MDKLLDLGKIHLQRYTLVTLLMKNLCWCVQIGFELCFIFFPWLSSLIKGSVHYYELKKRECQYLKSVIRQNGLRTICISICNVALTGPPLQRFANNVLHFLSKYPRLWKTLLCGKCKELHFWAANLEFVSRLSLTKSSLNVK